MRTPPNAISILHGTNGGTRSTAPAPPKSAFSPSMAYLPSSLQRCQARNFLFPGHSEKERTRSHLRRARVFATGFSHFEMRAVASSRYQTGPALLLRDRTSTQEVPCETCFRSLARVNHRPATFSTTWFRRTRALMLDVGALYTRCAVPGPGTREWGRGVFGTVIRHHFYLIP